MIAKLKHECGYQFTSKLEGMFKDVELSRDARAGDAVDGHDDARGSIDARAVVVVDARETPSDDDVREFASLDRAP